MVFVWLEVAGVENGGEIRELLQLVPRDELYCERTWIEAWVRRLGKEIVESLGRSRDVHGGDTIGFDPDEESKKVGHVVSLHCRCGKPRCRGEWVECHCGRMLICT